LLSDLIMGKIEKDILKCGPLFFLDTAGAVMDEDIDIKDIHESKFNVGECDLVLTLVEELQAAFIDPTKIGIITPYRAQVNALKKLMQQ
jgi:superfamily I DNA and/or RNA helicase